MRSYWGFVKASHPFNDAAPVLGRPHPPTSSAFKQRHFPAPGYGSQLESPQPPKGLRQEFAFPREQSISPAQGLSGAGIAPSRAETASTLNSSGVRK
jgi:hypothetical protein